MLDLLLFPLTKPNIMSSSYVGHVVRVMNGDEISVLKHQLTQQNIDRWIVFCGIFVTILIGFGVYNYAITIKKLNNAVKNAEPCLENIQKMFCCFIEVFRTQIELPENDIPLNAFIINKLSDLCEQAWNISKSILEKDDDGIKEMEAMFCLISHLKFDGDKGLEYAEKSVAIYENITKNNIDKLLPDLVIAQEILSDKLLKEGHIEKAIKYKKKLVEHYEELVKKQREMYLSNLAKSRIDLANAYRELREYPDALHQAHEAVNHYAELAKRNRRQFLFGWAGAIKVYANMLNESNNEKKALEQTKEAVALFRELACYDRKKNLPYLAETLKDYSNRASNEEGLEAALNCVLLYDEITKQNLYDYFPSFAESFNNLSEKYRRSKKIAEALVEANNAIRVYKNVCNELSNTSQLLENINIEYLKKIFRSLENGRYLSGLAKSINIYAIMLNESGESEQALKNIKEVIKIREELTSRKRVEHLPSLARAKKDFVTILSTCNTPAQNIFSVSVMEEVVNHYRELTLECRNKFLPFLADALNEYSNKLSDEGFLETALECSRESCDYFDELSRHDAASYSADYAGSLYNLARRLNDNSENNFAIANIKKAILIKRILVNNDANQHISRWVKYMNFFTYLLMENEQFTIEIPIGEIEKTINEVELLCAASNNIYQYCLGTLNNNLGILLGVSGNDAKSLEKITIAKKNFETVKNDSFSHAMSQNNQAVALHKNGYFTDAYNEITQVCKYWLDMQQSEESFDLCYAMKSFHNASIIYATAGKNLEDIMKCNEEAKKLLEKVEISVQRNDWGGKELLWIWHI